MAFHTFFPLKAREWRSVWVSERARVAATEPIRNMRKGQVGNALRPSALLAVWGFQVLPLSTIHEEKQFISTIRSFEGFVMVSNFSSASLWCLRRFSVPTPFMPDHARSTRRWRPCRSRAQVCLSSIPSSPSSGQRLPKLLPYCPQTGLTMFICSWGFSRD